MCTVSCGALHFPPHDINHIFTEQILQPRMAYKLRQSKPATSTFVAYFILLIFSNKIQENYTTWFKQSTHYILQYIFLIMIKFFLQRYSFRNFYSSEKVSFLKTYTTHKHSFNLSATFFSCRKVNNAVQTLGK